MKRVRVAGATILLLALTLSVYGGTTAAAAAGATASTDDPEITSTASQTFTLQVNGAAVTETCSGTSAISKSSTFPGHIRGRAWVNGCAPEPAASCAQTADMQTQNIHTGVWDSDGDGATKHGCAGSADASVITKNCTATSLLLAYRTMGIFVVIDSQGDTLTWHGPSPVLNVTRIC